MCRRKAKSKNRKDRNAAFYAHPTSATPIAIKVMATHRRGVSFSLKRRRPPRVMVRMLKLAKSTASERGTSDNMANHRKNSKTYEVIPAHIHLSDSMARQWLSQLSSLTFAAALKES